MINTYYEEIVLIMTYDTYEAHPGGFIEDESTGIERSERIQTALEIGRRILESPQSPADFNGKDRILLAFAPTTKRSRISGLPLK